MLPTAKDYLERVAVSGALNLAWAGYLRWLARKIAAEYPLFGEIPREGSIPALRAAPQAIERMAKQLRTAHPSMSARQTEVAAFPIAGMFFFLEYCKDVGAIDIDQDKTLLRRAMINITATAVHHSTIEMGGDSTPVGSMIAQIRDACAPDGRFYIDRGESVVLDDPSEFADRPRSSGIKPVLVGKYVSYRDEVAGKVPIVALIPGRVAEILKRIDNHNLANLFRSVAVVNAAGNFDAQFIYDDEPDWSRDVEDVWYVDDLAHFPRDMGHRPQWLRRHLSRALELPP